MTTLHEQKNTHSPTRPVFMSMVPYIHKKDVLEILHTIACHKATPPHPTGHKHDGMSKRSFTWGLSLSTMAERVVDELWTFLGLECEMKRRTMEGENESQESVSSRLTRGDAFPTDQVPAEGRSQVPLLSALPPRGALRWPWSRKCAHESWNPCVQLAGWEHGPGRCARHPIPQGSLREVSWQ